MKKIDKKCMFLRGEDEISHMHVRVPKIKKQPYLHTHDLYQMTTILFQNIKMV